MLAGRPIPWVAVPGVALVALAVLAWSAFQGPLAPRSGHLARTETPAERPPVLRGRPGLDAAAVAEATRGVPDPPRGLDADGRLLPGVEWLAGTVRARDGTPVGGAGVHAYSYRFGRSHARTEADGTFRVTVPADDEFRLLVEAEAQGRATRYGLRWAADTRLDIDLPPVFTTHGRVVRRGADGGWIGVPGARVHAFAFEVAYYRGESAHGGSYAGEGVLTEDDGSFTYPGIVKSGTLRVVSDVWYQPDGPVVWRRGSEPVLEVLPRASVSGRVLADDGRPLPGAEVSGGRRSRHDRGRTTVADAEGRFTLAGIAMGAERVMIRASLDAWRGSGVIEGHPGADVTGLVLRCERTPSIRGRVASRAGDPLEGTLVVADWRVPGADGDVEAQDAATRTEADGTFLLTRLPEAAVDVRVHATDRAPLDVAGVHPTPEGTDLGTLTPTLRPAHTIQVLDPTGRPLLTATVDGKAVDERGVLASRRPLDRDVERRVRAPGHAPRVVRLGPTDRASIVTLEHAHVIEGRVLDVDGRPVCGAAIRTWDGQRLEAWSNLAGRFRLEVAEAKAYPLHVWDLFHHYPPPIEAEAGGPDVRIRAVVPCHLAGRVVDPQGRGIPGVLVWARWDERDDARSQNDTTDEDGVFHIDDLVGASFRIQTRDDDLRGLGIRVRDLHGVRPYTEDVLMQGEAFGTPHGPHAIRGTVVWPDGRPAAEVEVEVDLEGAEDGWFDDSAESTPDGTFAIEGLRAGRYSVWAWTSIEVDADHDGEAESEVEYECEAGIVEAGTEGLRIVLRALPPEDEEDDED